MEQEKEKIFKPAKIIKIPNNIAQAWILAGAYLWENNGIPWPGNAYLEAASIYQQNIFDRETEKLGIDWRDYAEYHDGYTTKCFGFHLESDSAKCTGIDDEALKICSKLMQELGIEWCGWDEPADFELIATEQQILELERRLQEPIAEWKRQESIHRYSF